MYQTAANKWILQYFNVFIHFLTKTARQLFNWPAVLPEVPNFYIFWIFEQKMDEKVEIL